MISAGRMGGRAACCLITLSLQVFSMLRCPRCLGTGKTEDRDHTHLVHLARCDGGHAGKHQTKAPGVTDGVAEWEGNQLCLKVFHLFFISVRRLQAHFWWQHPPGLFYGYVRHPDSVCQNFTISWWNCKCVYWLCVYPRVGTMRAVTLLVLQLNSCGNHILNINIIHLCHFIKMYWNVKECKICSCSYAGV